MAIHAITSIPSNGVAHSIAFVFQRRLKFLKGRLWVWGIVGHANLHPLKVTLWVDSSAKAKLQLPVGCRIVGNRIISIGHVLGAPAVDLVNMLNYLWNAHAIKLVVID